MGINYCKNCKHWAPSAFNNGGAYMGACMERASTVNGDTRYVATYPDDICGSHMPKFPTISRAMKMRCPSCDKELEVTLRRMED